MGRGGRRPASTRTQREQVRALAAAGESQREIAERVFRDARYRGSVERILRALPRRALPQEVARPTRPAESVSDTLASLGEPPDLRQLFAGMLVREWRDLAARGDLPSPDPLKAELEALGFGSTTAQ